jgi:hypothetical protein
MAQDLTTGIFNITGNITDAKTMLGHKDECGRSGRQRDDCSRTYPTVGMSRIGINHSGNGACSPRFEMVYWPILARAVNDANAANAANHELSSIYNNLVPISSAIRRALSNIPPSMSVISATAASDLQAIEHQEPRAGSDG